MSNRLFVTWWACYSILMLLALIVPALWPAYYLIALPTAPFLVGEFLAQIRQREDLAVAQLAADERELEKTAQQQMALAAICTEHILSVGGAASLHALLRVTGRHGLVEGNTLADLVIQSGAAKSKEVPSLLDTEIGREFLSLECPSLEDVLRWTRRRGNAR